MEKEKNKLCPTTRKEKLVTVNYELQQSKVALDSAKTVAAVHQALDKLSVLVEQMASDSYIVSTFDGDFSDFRGTINSVKLHQTTLNELSYWFDTLCQRTNELIAEEIKKEETAAKLRALLTEALAHVDEILDILDILDIDKIVK